LISQLKKQRTELSWLLGGYSLNTVRIPTWGNFILLYFFYHVNIGLFQYYFGNELCCSFSVLFFGIRPQLFVGVFLLPKIVILEALFYGILGMINNTILLVFY